MNRQVTYLMSGAAHLPYLVCSVWTLREFWGGPVEIYCWPESYDLARLLEEDRKLGVRVHKRTPKLRRSDGYGGNSQFLDKIDLTMSLGCDFSLYLDADTTVHGDILPVFEAARVGFAATQWNDWTTKEGHAHRRVKDLLEIDLIPDEYVETVINSDWPSVNGGVWAASPRSRVLPTWYNWTKACKSLFISDERVLHLMPAAFPAEFVVITENGKYNSSPKFQAISDEEVVIRHYHGDSNVRPKKSQRGFDLWWPIYQECLLKNVGKMSEWIGHIDNKHMNRLKKEGIDIHGQRH